MSRISQNLDITKDFFSELYFKVFIHYENNKQIKEATCVIYKDGFIIKKVEPIAIQENGVYFKLGNDVDRGNYHYSITALINNEVVTLISNKEVNIV